MSSNADFLTEIVRQKGLENITVDDLVAEITPKGRGFEEIFVLCHCGYCDLNFRTFQIN